MFPFGRDIHGRKLYPLSPITSANNRGGKCKQMKFFLQKTLILGFYHAVAILPLPLMRLLARFLSWAAWWLPNESRRVTCINLARCYPDKTTAERKKMARESLYHTILTALEIPRVWQQPVEKTLNEIGVVEGQTLIDQARDKGKGVMVIAPHLGNWEYLGSYLACHYPLICLYKPQKEAWRNALIHRGRSKPGTRLAPTTRKGVMAVVKALKNGEVTGILPDQIPDKNSGIEYAPFFGQQTATMTLIPSLATRDNVIAVTGFAQRLPNGHFAIIFQPVPEALYSKDTHTSVAALNQAVEELIAQAPEQYQWEYKRFRRGPGYQKTAVYER